MKEQRKRERTPFNTQDNLSCSVFAPNLHLLQCLLLVLDLLRQFGEAWSSISSTSSQWRDESRNKRWERTLISGVKKVDSGPDTVWTRACPDRVLLWGILGWNSWDLQHLRHMRVSPVLPSTRPCTRHRARVVLEKTSPKNCNTWGTGVWWLCPTWDTPVSGFQLFYTLSWDLQLLGHRRVMPVSASSEPLVTTHAGNALGFTPNWLGPQIPTQEIKYLK